MCQRFRFMSLDWSTFLREIAHLPHDIRSVVATIVGKTWDRGDPYPDDDHVLARIGEVTLRRWRKIRSQIVELFDISNGFWRHHLVEEARAFAEGQAKPRRPQRPTKYAFVGKNRRKINDPPSCNGNALSPEEGDIARPDVRENAPAASPTAPPSFARKRQRKGKPANRRAWPPKTTLAADWLPTAADIAFAEQRGHDHAVIAREAQSFADYHRAHGSRIADCGAAWRRWVNRINDFQPRQRENSSGVLAGLRAWGAARESYGARHG
jgi:uncharacterized protein YdaU (DUF1376 family)